MKPYYAESGIEIYHGNCLDVLATFAANRFSTVITDPPYELGFMGKAWDSTGIAFQPDTWRAVSRVCKPGAMLLAFGGTRTFHRMTCAVEDAGWEIRDCMMWLYGSGFPKSMDISKAMDKANGAERSIAGPNPNHRPSHAGQENRWRIAEGRKPSQTSSPILTATSTDAAKLWNGWGTALKPAWEPVIIAMKPLEGTFVENAQRHGVAGLNINGGRIAGDKPETTRGMGGQNGRYGPLGAQGRILDDGKGRWPANIIFDEAAAALLDASVGELESGKPIGVKAGGKLNCYGEFAGGIPVTGYGDRGGPSRFYYTAKASRAERGLGNNHPTVKPLDLIKYLCKLTALPTGGEMLDPFAGSFTTLIAAQEYGRPCVGIDQEESHCKIGVERLRQGVLFGAKEPTNG